MKQIVHYGYDLTPRVNVEKIDDCVLDNTQDPIVRTGSEPFASYYPVEWCYNVCHNIDPSRSFVETALKAIDEQSSESNNWPASDAFYYLLHDLGVWTNLFSVAEVVAFWTMFPRKTAEFLALPYMKEQRFLNPHGNYIRVLNNPFFYRDPNAPIKRLVEIAALDGFRYALDRACFIPCPCVIAKEISLLHSAAKSRKLVDETTAALIPVIDETMRDWGLSSV